LPDTDRPVAPVVIKKYANRRLYDTEGSIYITLDSLAGMVRAGRDFVVFDAKTGDDITRSVLTQIIVEEETKGRNMLPTRFLRQLIGLYGDSAQGEVPAFLEEMMAQFAARSIKPAPQAKAVTPIMDRAKTLLSPFIRTAGKDEAPAEPQDQEIQRLRQEVERLNRALAAQKA
jgi:polyhydroxyalkanoate synthesis repressor PhaR